MERMVKSYKGEQSRTRTECALDVRYIFNRLARNLPESLILAQAVLRYSVEGPSLKDPQDQEITKG